MSNMDLIALIKQHMKAYDEPYWRALPTARRSAKAALQELLNEIERSIKS